MRHKTFKYVVDCKITVVAKNAIQAREKIKRQLETVDYGEDNPECIGSSEVEVFSKYNKLGRARRVKFFEGTKIKQWARVRISDKGTGRFLSYNICESIKDAKRYVKIMSKNFKAEIEEIGVSDK